MKKLTLSLIIFLNTFLAQSQNTTFSLGWGAAPEKILCAGNTWIVYGTEIEGPGKDGYLYKFKKDGSEYITQGNTTLPETLQDFRFHNGKLNIVAFRDFACDYYPRDLYHYEVDTASFSIVKTNRIGSNLNLVQAGFATDSTVFIWTDNFSSDSIIYNINTGLKSIHGLSGLLGIGSSSDFVTSIFNDELLYVYSSSISSGFVVAPDRASLPVNYVSHAPFPIQNPKHVYSFAQDSLCILADGVVHKTDTSFSSFNSISIPAFVDFKVKENRLYLFDSHHVQTYSLPDVQLLATDLLKGLPSGFDIKDVISNGSNLSIVAHNGYPHFALQQMVLKADIQSTNETDRNEIMLDSASYIAATPTTNGQVNT